MIHRSLNPQTVFYLKFDKSITISTTISALQRLYILDTYPEKAKSYLHEWSEIMKQEKGQHGIEMNTIYITHLILKGNIKRQTIKTKKGWITFSEPVQRYRGHIRKFELLNSFLWYPFVLVLMYAYPIKLSFCIFLILLPFILLYLVTWIGVSTGYLQMNDLQYDKTSK